MVNWDPPISQVIDLLGPFQKGNASLNGCPPYTLAFCMGEKEVPIYTIQNIWRTVTEISVTVDVCSGNVKYYILVRGTSEGDKSHSHISSQFAPIEIKLNQD